MYVCICMNIWVVAVLELVSHPDHNKGPRHAPCACPKTYPIDPSHTTLQATNSFIPRPLSRSHY